MTNQQLEPPVAPYLVVSDGPAALEFYASAFGAEITSRRDAPDGKRILHASLMLNGGVVHLSDDFPDMGGGEPRDPLTLGESTVTIALTLDDPDALWTRAVEAGASVSIPLEDQFWGARYGVLLDPFGHRWSLSTPAAEVSEEERAEGAAKAMSSGE
jgi:PhnB protein